MNGAGATIDRAALDELLGALRRRGYTVVGPQVRSGSIVYDGREATASRW